MTLPLRSSTTPPYRIAMPLKNGTDFIMPHYGECSDYHILLDNHIFNLLDFGPVEYSEQAAQELDALVRATFKNLIVDYVVQKHTVPRPSVPYKNKRREGSTTILVYLRERNARPKRFSAKWPSPGERHAAERPPEQ